MVTTLHICSVEIYERGNWFCIGYQDVVLLVITQSISINIFQFGSHPVKFAGKAPVVRCVIGTVNVPVV